MFSYALPWKCSTTELRRHIIAIVAIRQARRQSVYFGTDVLAF